MATEIPSKTIDQPVIARSAKGATKQSTCSEIASPQLRVDQRAIGTRNDGLHWFLTIIIFLGFLLRVWDLGYGLPVSYFMDETTFVYLGLNLGGGHLGHFSVDTFYPYLCFLFDAVYIAGCKFFGIYQNFGDAWQAYLADPTPYYVIARFVSVLFGTLTLPLTYWIGKKLFSRTAGVLGALFLAFSYLHVQYSSIAFRDSLFVFFVTASFALALKAFEESRARDFILCGLFSGFALSTKWSGPPVLMWGPLVLLLRGTPSKSAGFSNRESKKQSGRTPHFWKGYLFFLFAAVGFVIGNPSSVLRFSKFKSHILNGLNVFRPGGAGQIGREGDWNWLYYLRHTLPEGLGLPLLLFALLGILLLIVFLRREYFLFLAFPLVYFALAGKVAVHEARYMLPLVPFLCLAAAFFVSVIAPQGLSLRRRQGIAMTVVFLLTFLAVTPTLAKSLRYTYLKSQTDTRTMAYQWVRENVSSGSRILVTDYLRLPKISGVEMLDPTVTRQREAFSSLQSLEAYRQSGVNFIVIDEWHLSMIYHATGRRPEYKDAREKYKKFWGELEALGEPAALFNPYKDEKILFDPENVLFATEHLWKMERLGPRIWVYRL